MSASQSIQTQSPPLTMRLRGLGSYADLALRMPPAWPKTPGGRHPFGPGALPRPVPALANGGMYQDLGHRWTEAWAWLRDKKWTHEDQVARMRLISDICHEYGPYPTDVETRDRLDDLTTASYIPFADSPQHELWACDTDTGLIFVFASPERIADICGSRKAVALHGWPGILVATVGLAHSVPHDQVHPWGIAMEALGYLYW